jgi:hypothetical protein
MTRRTWNSQHIKMMNVWRNYTLYICTELSQGNPIEMCSYYLNLKEKKICLSAHEETKNMTHPSPLVLAYTRLCTKHSWTASHRQSMQARQNPSKGATPQGPHTWPTETATNKPLSVTQWQKCNERECGGWCSGSSCRAPKRKKKECSMTAKRGRVGRGTSRQRRGGWSGRECDQSAWQACMETAQPTTLCNLILIQSEDKTIFPWLAWRTTRTPISFDTKSTGSLLLRK